MNCATCHQAAEVPNHLPPAGIQQEVTLVRDDVKASRWQPLGQPTSLGDRNQSVLCAVPDRDRLADVTDIEPPPTIDAHEIPRRPLGRPGAIGNLRHQIGSPDGMTEYLNVRSRNHRGQRPRRIATQTSREAMAGASRRRRIRSG